MKRSLRVVCVRCVSLLLCFAMLLSMTAMAANGKFREDTEYNYFKYINGFEDGTVRPNATLTRAQGAKMLYYVLNLDSSDSGKSFNDVPSSFWGYKAIAALSADGIINGYAGNVFKPNNGLTRAEFSAILTRAMGISTAGKKNATLKDVSGHWAEESIAALTELGFIGGYSDGTFRPNAALTRAEAVKLINRAVNMKIDKTETQTMFSDLPETHWAFHEIMAAASTTALEVREPAGNVKFSEIEYISLSQTDFDAEVNKLVNEFNTAATSAKRAEAYGKFLKLQIEIATAVAMVNVNAERDVSNERYKADYESLSKIQDVIEKITIAQYNALKNAYDRDAVCKILGIKFEDIKEPESSMTQELIDIFTREAEYETEFNEYFNSPAIEHEGAMYSLSQAIYSGDEKLSTKGMDYLYKNGSKQSEIFNNLVQVRTELANYHGYETYSEIAYLSYGYTAEQIHAFRDAVRKYIVPLVMRIRFANMYDYGVEPLDTEFMKNADETISKVKAALKDLSPQSRQALEYMEKYEMFDLEQRENKSNGAFSIMLGKYEAPFLFMNEEGGFADVSTFSHEFGHTLQFFRIKNNNTPLDISEVASTSLELMMTNRYEEFFGENATDAEKYQVFNTLYSIVGSCMMDEFQEIIYDEPDMSPEIRNSVYLGLLSQYYGGTYDDSAHPALRQGYLWDNISHVFNRPFYMIQYALANTVSLQIWELSKTDFDAAFETYMRIIESDFTGYGLGAVAFAAGLESPYAEVTIPSIAQMAQELFADKDEAKKAA